MSRDDEHLRDMLRAADRAVLAVAGLQEDTFIVTEDLQDIVIRRLIVLGEAARRVTPERKAQLIDFPWTETIAMRNALIHDYDGINLAEVWHTVQHDLPPLVSRLSPIVGHAARPDLWEGL
jgi:uncharacterized protein with HEPN domain